MVTFISCELESREILAVRLRDDTVRLRLENASSSWGIEYAVLLRRVQVIIAMGLFSAHRDGREADSSQAALDVLRDVGPVELFGVLPADQGKSAEVVRQLRLLSTGITPGGPSMWERLIQTARNVLDVRAVYPDPDNVVGPAHGPSQTTGILTTEPRPLEGDR